MSNTDLSKAIALTMTTGCVTGAIIMTLFIYVLHMPVWVAAIATGVCGIGTGILLALEKD